MSPINFYEFNGFFMSPINFYEFNGFFMSPIKGCHKPRNSHKMTITYFLPVKNRRSRDKNFTIGEDIEPSTCKKNRKFFRKGYDLDNSIKIFLKSSNFSYGCL